MKRLMLALTMVCGLLFAYVGLVGADAASHPNTGGPGTHICTNPTQQTSDPQGHLGPYGPYVLSADVWNDVNIKQTVYGCNHNSWYVTESASGTAVQAFPDTNITYGPDKTIASYKTLTSNFRDGPLPTGSGLDYESAYDIWLGPQTEWQDASQHTEFMLWTDTDGQVPAGSVVASTTIDGHAFKVWFAGGLGQSNGDIVTYEAVQNYSSAQTNLPSFFADAAQRGYLTAGMNTYLWQIDYGYEICAAPAGSVFSVEAFNVVAS